MSLSKKEVFDNAFLKCITQLENFEECKAIDLRTGEPVSNQDVSIWERRNTPFVIPDDMKLLYSTFNGFNVLWTVDVGARTVAVGEYNLKKLDDVKRVNIETMQLDNGVEAPDPKADMAVVIDSCKHGDIILVGKPRILEDGTVQHRYEVWLIDIANRWHFMCCSFSDYLRLMVLHLGISGWQLVFTPEGLPQETFHWMNLFCKERLCVDLHYRALND